MKKNHIFSELSIIGLVFEILLITFVFFSIAYLSDKTDPLFLKSEINIFLILISVVTLFYGLLSGIILIIIIGIMLHIFYKPFPIHYFVNTMLFMLIFSEFHFFWNRMINKLKIQNEYLEEKMKELTKNFYLLKLSHDQLEKSYILKPTSLRNTITQIKNLYIQDPFKAYQELITIISKNYGVKKSAIFSYEDGRFEKEADLNFNEDLNEDSVVLNESIETKSVSYLSKFEDLKNDYLSAITACDSLGNLKFVFIIKDMQFLQYTKDNLFSIWVIINYFADFITHIENEKDIITKHQSCPNEFIIEIKRVAYIKKILDLKSFVLVLTIKNHIVNTENIIQLLSKNLRGMDVICSKNNGILILFPFINYSNMETIIEKFKKQLFDRFYLNEDSVSYKVFEVFKDYEKNLEFLTKTLNQ